MDKYELNNLLPRGKKIMQKRRPEIDKILEDNNCSINWKKNDKGHLLILSFNDDRENIEKQYGKKPYNIYHKVNLFFDFVEETFTK